MKESGGRKLFASVETLIIEKKRRNLVEQDDSQLFILGDYVYSKFAFSPYVD